jgi:hypothetical protein
MGLRSLGAAVACALVSLGCVIDDVEYAGKRCPCPAGFECDDLQGVCRRDPTHACARAELTASLAAHWKFDESLGTRAADSSGNGHHGTLHDGPSFAPGRIGNAIRFDGKNRSVHVPHAAALNPAGAFSIAVWFKRFSDDATAALLVKHDWNSENSTSLTFYGGVLRCCIGRHWNGGLEHDASHFAKDLWYHVVCAADEGGHKLYVNGALATASATTPTVVTSTSPLVIGEVNSNGGYFDGLIDDLRLYDRALTPADVQNVYGCAR